MNNTIIPTIILATALMAGALALVPVDEASAVHTTIQNSQMNEAGTVAAAMFSTALDSDSITVTSTADFVMGCIIVSNSGADLAFTHTDGTAVATSWDLNDMSSVGLNRAQNGGETVTLSGDVAADALCSAMTLTSGTIVFG